jgi:hypothetical protein
LQLTSTWTNQKTCLEIIWAFANDSIRTATLLLIIGL